MTMITVTFPDGNKKEYENGITGFEIAKSISHGLAKRILISNVNGIPYELNRPLNQNCKLYQQNYYYYLKLLFQFLQNKNQLI